MKQLYLFVLLLLITSCSAAVKLKSHNEKPATPADAPVVVVSISGQVPQGCLFLGELKVGDSGFSTDCNYNTVMELVRERTRKIGGNLIKLTSIKPPSFTSTCYRIRADIYHISQIPDEFKESIDSTLLKENCAMIYLYRDKSSLGVLVNYNVELNDEIVWRCVRNHKEGLKVIADTPVKLKAKTESTTELDIDIKPGRSYYVRCGLKMGVVMGRPTLSLIESNIAKEEYESIKN